MQGSVYISADTLFSRRAEPFTKGIAVGEKWQVSDKFFGLYIRTLSLSQSQKCRLLAERRKCWFSNATVELPASQVAHDPFIFGPGGHGTPVIHYTNLSWEYSLLLNGKCNLVGGKWDHEALSLYKTIQESLGRHLSEFKFSGPKPISQLPVLLGSSTLLV